MISKNSEHAIQLKLCSSKLANPFAQDFGDSKVLILTDGWKPAWHEIFHTLWSTPYQTGAGFGLDLAINRIWNLIMKFCIYIIYHGRWVWWEQQNLRKVDHWSFQESVLNFRISLVNRFIDSLVLLQLTDSHNNLNVSSRGIFQTTIIPSSHHRRHVSPLWAWECILVEHPAVKSSFTEAVVDIFTSGGHDTKKSHQQLDALNTVLFKTVS